MSEGKRPTFNIDIGVGAKAEVKTEIPAESSGRLIDALTDIIRPFSERRGLAADMLRLQRAEVAIAIADLARRRLQIEGKEPVPLPNKVVVPLLEKGSLEAPDDQFMISKWAALLSSGGKDVEVQPRYVSILGELSSSQVTLLTRMARNNIDNWKHPHQQFGDAWILYNSTRLDRTILDYFKLCDTNSPDLLQDMYNVISGPGRFVMYMRIDRDDVFDDYSIDDFTNEDFTTGEFLPQKIELDIEILSSLSLVAVSEREISKRAGGHKYKITLKCAYITWLGTEFIELCDPDLRKDLRAVEPSFDSPTTPNSS